MRALVILLSVVLAGGAGAAEPQQGRWVTGQLEDCVSGDYYLGADEVPLPAGCRVHHPGWWVPDVILESYRVSISELRAEVEGLKGQLKTAEAGQQKCLQDCAPKLDSAGENLQNAGSVVEVQAEVVADLDPPSRAMWAGVSAAATLACSFGVYWLTGDDLGGGARGLVAGLGGGVCGGSVSILGYSLDD